MEDCASAREVSSARPYRGIASPASSAEAPSVSENDRVLKVSFVEDNPQFADHLAALLRELPGVQLLDCCSTGEEAVRRMRAKPPDVALIDLQLPGLSGFECILRLAPLLPETTFLVLTSLSDERSIFEAMRAGAVGYLLKADAAGIGDFLRRAGRGDAPMSPGVARLMVKHFARAEPAAAEVMRLSGRESEVLRALARGERYKEVAESLQLNSHTLRTYIRRIYRKLAVTSRTEAVAKYLRSAPSV